MVYRLEKNFKLKGPQGYTHIRAAYERCRQKDGGLRLCEFDLVPIMVWFTYQSKTRGKSSATVSIGLWESGSIRFLAAEYEGKCDAALPSRDTLVSFFEGAVKQLIPK